MTDTAVTPQPGFWNWARTDPDRVAVVEHDGQETTFGEMAAAVNRVSHGLRALGLKKGDGVAVVLPNERTFLDVYLAAMQSGLYFTAVNYHLTGPEIAYIVGDCEASVFVGHARFGEACRAAADELDFPSERRFAVGDVAGFRPFDDLVAGQPDAYPDERPAGMVMLYTSGTTGRPKGVRRPLTEADADATAAAGALSARLFEVAPGPGVHLCAGPLYHAAPSNFAVNAMHLGQTAVVMDKWTAEGTLERVERYRVTTSHMVPTMFHRLLALPQEMRDRADVSSLQTIIHAAAPCPVDVKQRMFDWWGPIIWEYYAATEGGGTFVRPKEWLDHPGTVGQPIAGTVVKAFDDDGNECPPGQPGTLWMRSSDLVGDFEYYKDKEKTDANHRDGMFTVGDVGYFDDDGWLFLCDRKSDMIISGGVNIYPAEIEAALLSHPKVGDAAVIGVPDRDWGEQVKAVVEPATGVKPGPELAQELIAFCRERLAHYKCPRSVDFREHLPRYATGKLYKRLIKDEYWQGRDTRI